MARLSESARVHESGGFVDCEYVFLPTEMVTLSLGKFAITRLSRRRRPTEDR